MTGPQVESTRIPLVGGLDEIYDHFQRNGMGDGLPIVPPTPERVHRLCESAGLAPTDEVAVIPPSMGVATAEKVAINAVMAGCRPEYMPVVVAAVRAFVDPEFNGRIVQATSNPAGVLVLMNGPIRRAIDAGMGANCLGQGSRANLTIGRALRLVLVNVGGATPGDVDKASQGFPGKVGFAFAEAEEESPWAPLHVDRGYGSSDSVVTLVAAHGTTNIVLHGRPNRDDLLAEMAHGMIQSGASNFAQGGIGSPLLVVTPTQAHQLADAGMSKADVQAHLFAHARVPLAWYPPHARASGDLDEVAQDGLVPIASSPADILVVVAGSPGTHATFIPSFGDSRATSALVGPG